MEKVLKGQLEFPYFSGFYISLLKVRGHEGLNDSQNVPLVNTLNVTHIKMTFLCRKPCPVKVLVLKLAGPLMQPLSQAVLWDPFFPVVIQQKKLWKFKADFS